MSQCFYDSDEGEFVDFETLAEWESRDKSQRDRIEALEAALDEMTRRRDEWRKKAEGYDAVRLALREKVGAPWPPNMSRVLWAGIAADEKKRADDAEAALLAADELAREISVMMDQCEDGDGYTAIAAHNVATALIAYRSAADGK